MMYGLWITDPPRWTGWFSTALNGKQYPMRFPKEEAEMRADLCRKAMPSSAVEVRGSPPTELPWNEEAWREATA